MAARLKLVDLGEGISTVRERFPEELVETIRPEREKRLEEAFEYARRLAEAAMEIRARQLAEQARVLQQQIQERAQGKVVNPETETIFRECAETWYLETMPLSSYIEKILHPAYQRIIGLGRDAVPLIMNELRDMPHDWFWALRAITGKDPVSPENAGDLTRMANIWLQWWEQEGRQWWERGTHS